jgi:hypothetical protein
VAVKRVTNGCRVWWFGDTRTPNRLGRWPTGEGKWQKWRLPGLKGAEKEAEGRRAGVLSLLRCVQVLLRAIPVPPCALQIRPHAVQIQPHTLQMLPNMHQLRKNIRQLLMKLRQLPINFRQLPKKIRQLQPKLRQLQKQFRQLQMRLCQLQMKFRQLQKNFCQLQANPRQMRKNRGKTDPTSILAGPRCYVIVTRNTQIVPNSIHVVTVAQMRALPSLEQAPSHPVKVLPIQDGWCVAVGRGHYAQPLSRDVAVMRATAIARTMQLEEIGVYDHDVLVERIAC